MARSEMPFRQPGDSPAMTQAVDALEALEVKFRRPTRSQLKIGHINFYPETGTIHLDGGKALEKQRGLQAVLDLLSEARGCLDNIIELRTLRDR